MENKKEKKLIEAFAEREWLNKDPARIAFIATSVEEVSLGDKYPHLYAEITIGDCGRSISLDFNCYSDEGEKEFNNNINKLNILENKIQRFHEQYVKAYKVFKEAREKADMHTNKNEDQKETSDAPIAD